MLKEVVHIYKKYAKHWLEFTNSETGDNSQTYTNTKNKDRRQLTNIYKHKEQGPSKGSITGLGTSLKPGAKKQTVESGKTTQRKPKAGAKPSLTQGNQNDLFERTSNKSCSH